MGKNLPGPTSIAPCAPMHILGFHVGLRAEPEKLHCRTCLGHQRHLECRAPRRYTQPSSKDAERVAAANRVYAAGCRLIVLCILRGVRWSLEQPARSWFWATSFWQFVLTFAQPLYVTFHACMFGGQRPKKTTIATDINELTELACECTKPTLTLALGLHARGLLPQQPR